MTSPLSDAIYAADHERANRKDQVRRKRETHRILTERLRELGTRPLDVGILAQALHEVGIGCPVTVHWGVERHDADWHDHQAAALSEKYGSLKP